MSFLELRVPPLVVVVTTALLMWVLADALPVLTLVLYGAVYIAVLLAAAGIAVVIAAALAFRRAGTTFDPLDPGGASALVTRGIFRISRNPMYLGFAMLLAAWAIYLANPASFLLVFGYIAYLTRYQIIPEERALEARFPEDFAEYSQKVRRWI